MDDTGLVSATTVTSTAGEEKRPPEAARISIDEFAKVDLRVGRIVKADVVPRSNKLLRLEIDIGSGVRQVVAGLAKAYAPEVLEGRYVIVVANLKPAMLMGLESNGMVLAATSSDGQPVLLMPEEPDQIRPGTKVR